MADFALIAFDALDPRALAQFWSGVTGQPLAVANEQFAMLEPAGAAPRIVFHRVAETKQAKNRVHLDLRSADRTAEVVRLVGLGALEAATHTENGRTWTVMLDPDGNEFCIAQA